MARDLPRMPSRKAIEDKRDRLTEVQARDLHEVIERANARGEDGTVTFLTDLLTQVENGRPLSEKQLAAVAKNRDRLESYEHERRYGSRSRGGGRRYEGF